MNVTHNIKYGHFQKKKKKIFNSTDGWMILLLFARFALYYFAHFSSTFEGWGKWGRGWKEEENDDAYHSLFGNNPFQFIQFIHSSICFASQPRLPNWLLRPVCCCSLFLIFFSFFLLRFLLPRTSYINRGFSVRQSDCPRQRLAGQWTQRRNGQLNKLN